MTWALITGEYPPQPGGVSDYTRLLARGLAASGDQVHVWAPDCVDQTLPEKGVQVHRLPGLFGPKAISMLASGLRKLPESCRVLVQYVPDAFGWKAMNVPFCLWLASRRRQPVWVMYHEVAYSLSRSHPVKRNLLGAVTQAMASLIARPAERVYISIPAWKALLPKRPLTTWLPIPSTVPTSVDAENVASARARLAPQTDQVLIGHFGTFGFHVARLLREILPQVLEADPRRVALLLGGGGQEFARELIQAHPSIERRVIAPGVLPGKELAAHLAACDLLLQPYADGVSGRRTSVMAGLALGLPIVTTEGFLTEPVWKESGAVALAPALSTAAFLEVTEVLLTDASRREALRREALRLYQDRFALANTIRELRS